MVREERYSLVCPYILEAKDERIKPLQYPFAEKVLQAPGGIKSYPVPGNRGFRVRRCGVCCCWLGAYSSLEEGMKAMVLTALEYTEYYQKWTSTINWLEKLNEEMK